jgi:hypothetical protein
LRISNHRDKSFTFQLSIDKPLKLYAGQPDPKDASHFTIRYTAGEEEGFIDGWLQDDDTVKLKQRPGAASRPAGR